jgi:hypothetical protein
MVGRGEPGSVVCPRLLGCVFCSKEFNTKEKSLDVPGRMNEVAHVKCWEENNRPRSPQPKPLVLGHWGRPWIDVLMPIDLAARSGREPGEWNAKVTHEQRARQ